MRKLREGQIFEIASAAGLVLRFHGDKALLRCPFHDDLHASAFVSTNNVFFCSVCTPEGGWPAKKFAEALGQPWGDDRELPRAPSIARRNSATHPAFRFEDAQQAWSACATRARDDDAVVEDQEVYSYLARRRLLPSWEDRAFGVVPPRADVPAAISSWHRRGYRLVAPLYTATGSVAGLQARGIPEGCNPKTLFPRGSQVVGLMFADRRGHQLLTGDAPDGGTVVLGEGMTDMLALAIASPYPVFSSPGTSNARAAVGLWASGRRVIVALDNDDAGQRALPHVAAALYEHGAEEVMGVRWPSGAKDACDVLAQRGEVGLGKFLLHASERRPA